ncbi:hypothetical protein TrLO_g7592 [Triparma laevis f. longispina]|uniref:Uncharacterized protein n=1 Tax=Triparma laevis f. longispina TaxID=1714387 RepID=A0A9W7CCR0_9STRA|nr:hypothetical protein TrLO_g7592 [Triparma laevis f. longispina]
MEALKQKALEKQQRVQEEERRKQQLESSRLACIASLMWHACGIVVNLHRKDVPRLTIHGLHGKHTDGVVLITSREAVPNRFTANHCKLTYYDKVTKKVTGDHLEIEGNVFYYDPPTHQEKIDNILKKDETKLTHHEKVILEKLRSQNAESKVLDFSCTYVPPSSRPKGFNPVPFQDLNEWMSDLSESEEEEEDSSDEEEGFSMLLDSAIMGKVGKGNEKRKRRAEREERRIKREAEREVRRKEREVRRAQRERHEGKKKRMEEREMNKLEEDRLKKEEASHKSSTASVMLDDLTAPKAAAERGEAQRPSLFGGPSTSTKSAASFKSAALSIVASQQWTAKQANGSLSTWGGSREEEESDSSEDDTGIQDWQAPEIAVGDELIIMQFPDIHDNHHPTELKAKVHQVDGATMYYRVDPTLDTHRFFTGAALVKFFKKERAYRIIGLHRGRTTEINGKPIQWCHHGMQLTYALRRMRKDIFDREQHEVEASQVEEKQQVANYRKMAMLAAKSDLDTLLAANKGGVASSKTIEAIGPINSDRARDLLLNAEAGGIHDVVVLMSTFAKDLEMQSMAMRICVRVLLGTHVQHGRYLKQVERIAKFGDLGIVKHACAVMRTFPDSPQILTSSLWLLSLMTQNVQNARIAGQNHIASAVCSALKTFAVFGKASPSGQKWGAACVMNLCKNMENRNQLVEEGVLDHIVLLLDNSKSVQTDYLCICSVLGAITELGRPPNFESRRKLVDLKVHINIKDTRERVLARKTALELEESGVRGDSDEENTGAGGEGDDEEGEYRKFNLVECNTILDQVEACFKVLSFGIPETAWAKAVVDKTFKIDWSLLRAAYKLDAFEKDKKGVVHGKAKKWLTGTKDTKIRNMRNQYKSKRGNDPGSGDDGSLGSMGSMGSRSSRGTAGSNNNSVSFAR